MGRVTQREALLARSKQGLAANVPKLAIHILVAALIWAFGQLTFVSLAQSFFLFDYNLAPVVSAIGLIVLLVVLVRAAFTIRDTVDTMAGVAAVSVSTASTDEESLGNYQKGFGGVLYLVYAVVIFLFLYAFLANIHPALAGIVLVLLAIWSILVLFQVGGVFSRAVEEWSGRTVNRVADRLQVGRQG
jgi:hypothetical protein